MAENSLIPASPIQLINFDRAREALALAHSVDEVKQIRDQAEAIRAYIKQQKGSFEMQNQAAEIKLRAERRAGELLKVIPKEQGVRRDLTLSTADIVLYTDVLRQNEVAPATAQRWQLEAEIPEEKFEQFIAETKAAAEELTSVAAVRIAQKMKREAQVEAAPPLPDGIFDVIYADPPWQYDNAGIAGAAEMHYKTMSIEEICTVRVPSASDSCLFLWVTNPFLQDALEVVDAWGFEYKTNVVWIKDRAGQGFYVKGQHELLLICVKGNMRPSDTIYVRSVVSTPRLEHSKKPTQFYELIEELYPQGKYLELFARNKRDRWTSWGNEVGN